MINPDKTQISKNDLEVFIDDIEILEQLENEAEKDLQKIEQLDFWKPTPYEKIYLPALRLTGYEKNDGITLLNEADLHIHSQWSDGDDLDKILDAAIEQKLDAIAITDHNEIDGAIEARRRVHKRRLKIAVVPATEVSSKDGHIGALFVMKKIPRNLSAEETVNLIHEAGGIAVAHHPYAPKFIDKILRTKLGCGDLIKKIPFDAIECTNAVPGYGTRYNIAAHEALRKNHIHIAMTGSSDAHYAGFVGKGKTYYAGNQGVSSLYAMLKLGFTRGSESYWKFSEKILYRLLLAKGIIRNFLKNNQSIN